MDLNMDCYFVVDYRGVWAGFSMHVHVEALVQQYLVKCHAFQEMVPSVVDLALDDHVEVLLDNLVVGDEASFIHQVDDACHHAEDTDSHQPKMCQFASEMAVLVQGYHKVADTYADSVEVGVQW